MVWLSQMYMAIGKTIALTLDSITLVDRVLSLLFNTLSRFVIAFLPRSSCSYLMATVTIYSDFRAQEEEICHCFHIFSLGLP